MKNIQLASDYQELKMDISFQKSSLEQLSSHNTAEARQMEERIDLLKKKHADQINETVKAF